MHKYIKNIIKRPSLSSIRETNYNDSKLCDLTRKYQMIKNDNETFMYGI